jgi:hypothetical protein
MRTAVDVRVRLHNDLRVRRRLKRNSEIWRVRVPLRWPRFVRVPLRDGREDGCALISWGIRVRRIGWSGARHQTSDHGRTDLCRGTRTSVQSNSDIDTRRSAKTRIYGNLHIPATTLRPHPACSVPANSPACVVTDEGAHRHGGGHDRGPAGGEQAVDLIVVAVGPAAPPHDPGPPGEQPSGPR